MNIDYNAKFALSRLALLAALLSLLSGCLGGPVPETRFFVLNALAEGRMDNAPDRPISLLMSELALPDYLERGQVVSRATPNRLTLSDFDQWGGSLRKDMGRVVSINLGRFLGTPDISSPPTDPGARPDYRLRIDILGFEHGPDSQVRLSARWTLRDDRTGKVLSSRFSEMNHAAAGPEDVDAMVAAMSVLLAELSREIAAAIAMAANGAG
ncbi:MAG: PqiC family protein [Gammaproteobacteria bacterium]